MYSDTDYLPLQQGAIYGPIQSRRLGPSLGVNLLPADRKLCSFNCVYCQYGPAPARHLSLSREYSENLVSKAEVERLLRDALARHPDVNYITFSGNGEPTLHPEFPEMVDLVIRVRDELKLRARIAILTNSTGILHENTRNALMRIESPFLKLDVGSEELFRKVNRADPEIGFSSIVEELERFNHSNLMTQAIFFSGNPDNTEDRNVAQWAEILRRIEPREVHIYSIDRPVAKSSIHPVDTSILKRIAERAQTVSGVPVRVF